MERPQIIEGPDGHFHLFFNCWARFVNPDWAKKHLHGMKPSDSSLYHFISPNLLDPFHPAPFPIVRGSEATALYGVRLVEDSYHRHIFRVMAWKLEEISLEVSGSWLLQWDVHRAPYLYRTS